MNEETMRQRIELARAQSTRERSEFMRWVLLLAMNINRPTQSTLRFLLEVRPLQEESQRDQQAPGLRQPAGQRQKTGSAVAG